MPFFRSVVFYAAVAGAVYAGLKVDCPPELAGALVPLLFLLLTVDVQHFLTLGTIDLRTCFHVLMARAPLGAASLYTSRVLPWDVDDSGLLKPDRAVRILGYALRKLWLGSNFEKDLASAGYALRCRRSSVQTVVPLGALTGFRVRSQVVALRDDLGSFFLEQKVLLADNKAALVSYTEFQIYDTNDLRRMKAAKGLAEKPALSKVLAHVVTRKLSGSKKKGKPKAGDKKAQAIQAALSDVASLCLESRLASKPELQKFVAFCGDGVAAAAAASQRTAVPITEDDDDNDADADEGIVADDEPGAAARKPKANPERMAKALEGFVRDLKSAKKDN